MVSPIADIIIRKGVEHVDTAKLAPELRRTVLEEAGTTLQKLGRHREAALAFTIAESAKLREAVAYYAQAGLFSVAAEYARHLEDVAELERVAAENLRLGNREEALRLYRKAGNGQMVRFIEENL